MFSMRGKICFALCCLSVFTKKGINIIFKYLSHVKINPAEIAILWKIFVAIACWRLLFIVINNHVSIC